MMRILCIARIMCNQEGIKIVCRKKRGEKGEGEIYSANGFDSFYRKGRLSGAPFFLLDISAKDALNGSGKIFGREGFE